MFNLFKKSYKRKYGKKFEKATQHKMFSGCKFQYFTADEFLSYSCNNDDLSGYMCGKIGEPDYPQRLEISCDKDYSLNDGSAVIKLILPFDDFSPFLDEELEAIRQAHNARKEFSAVECTLTYCDVREEDKMNGLQLVVDGVDEENFEEKLDLILEATYTLLENINVA